MSTQNNKHVDLENLAKSHHKKLLYFVLHKVRNEEDARDIVQSTYMEAIKSANNFRHESKPETWLTGIAINLIKHHFYNKKHKPISYLEDEQNYLINEIDDFTPEISLINKQMIHDIEHTFNKMPKDMRNTAKQVLICGLSYEEASKVNNDYDDKISTIPIGTIRSRVARAREMLRKLKLQKFDH
ncbi:MAG: RNA polymerase sigma factor [Chitinophagaceae bacterium]